MPHPIKRTPLETAGTERQYWHLTAHSLASSPRKYCQKSIKYGRHCSLPFLCPYLSNFPHGKHSVQPQFLLRHWIFLSKYCPILSLSMSSLFSIWAVDPTPYAKPSPASQRTLYCGTLPTFSNYLLLPWRWRRWLVQWRWQRWHRCLLSLLKLWGGTAMRHCIEFFM